MPSDFGDDSGEKMVDWMIAIGQDAGDSVMCSSAEKLKNAFRKAREGSAVIRETGENGVLGIEGRTPEWAKLSMADFKELPGYDSLKELIDGQLDKSAIEHDFYEDKQEHEWLLFKIQDASDVSDVFHRLEDRTSKALEQSLQRRGKTREQVRDEEALEARAKAAREASRAVNSKLNRERDVERVEVRSK